MSTQPGYDEARPSHSIVGREGSGERLMEHGDHNKVFLPIGCPLVEEASMKFKPDDEFLKKGSFGSIRHAATLEGKDVAIKYFTSRDIKGGYNDELTILNALQTHDNIVVLLGAGLSPMTKEPFVVMEFAPYSLNRVLHGYPRYTYKNDHVMHWARQTALGLEYIHSKRILYRDVKSSNLLLFGNGSHLKLCDFGISCNIETDATYTSGVGTPRYMAPEVIKGTTYDTKCDIFSFAITLWEMLARQIPTIEGLDDNSNIYAVFYAMAQLEKRPPLLVGHPSFVNELLQKCWDQDPRLRPTSTELAEELGKICKNFKFGEPIFCYDEIGQSLYYIVPTCIALYFN